MLIIIILEFNLRYLPTNFYRYNNIKFIDNLLNVILKYIEFYSYKLHTKFGNKICLAL